jgi:multidrug resistance efflux pump
MHDKVITRIEFESFRKNLLNQKISATDNASSIIQTNLQQKEYEKNISETELNMQGEGNLLQQKVRDAIRKFKGDYAVWQQKYILKSPVPGKVVFFKYWKENQYVVSGAGVFMIVPQCTDYIVRGSININNAGKINKGQHILIRLSSYPSEEYGFISGRVLSKSIIAMDTAYSIEIALTNGLVTNYGKIIPSQFQMDGVGEIITQNKSLFRRFFEKVYANREY